MFHDHRTKIYVDDTKGFLIYRVTFSFYAFLKQSS